jgi:uncharacterized protein
MPPESLDIRETDGGVVFTVKVFPNAGRNAVAGAHNGMLKVKIAAQPEKGKANSELAGFLGRVLKVRRSGIRIIKGLNSREKVIFAEGTAKNDIIKLLEGKSGRP